MNPKSYPNTTLPTPNSEEPDNLNMPHKFSSRVPEDCRVYQDDWFTITDFMPSGIKNAVGQTGTGNCHGAAETYPNPNLSLNVPWMQHIDWLRANGKVEFDASGYSPTAGDLIAWYAASPIPTNSGTIPQGALLHSAVVMYKSLVSARISMFEKTGTGSNYGARIWQLDMQAPHFGSWHSYWH